MSTGRSAIRDRLYHGLYPPEALEVLEAIAEAPLSLQSDLARQAAVWVAFLASLHFISTISPGGKTFMRQWRITNAGLIALNHKEMLWASST